MIQSMNKKIGFAIVLSIMGLASLAQEEKVCGTQIDEHTAQLIAEKLSNADLRGRTNQELKRMAITAHIIQRSDGSGGLTEGQLNSAIDVMNGFYANANIEFFLFGDIDYIPSDEYFDYDADQEDAVASKRDVPNTINIYFANSLTSSGSALCGYAYFPGNPDRIFMDNGCTTNGTTLSHEVGHYLTLYHTHGKTNNGTTDELVDGSNCTTAGDEICDTAADPNLSGKVNSSCQYTSNERDSNGDLFQPNTENIMSYAPQSCRRLFTSGQYDRAYSGLVNFREYITNKPYIAAFKPEQRVICVGEEITFDNESYGNFERVEWQFTGGSPVSSTNDNGTTSYDSEGVYDVQLTVFGADGGSDVLLIERAVQVVEYADITQNSLSIDFETSMIGDFTSLSPEDTYAFTIEQVGKDSESSLSMQFHGYEETGKTDLILIDPLGNPGSMDYVLSFDYAFTYYATSNGSVEIADDVSLIAKSCDKWETIWSANGKTNATASPLAQSFVPSNEEWGHVELYLPISETADFVQLALVSQNNNGNNFYLDNINVAYAETIVVRSLQTSPEQCAGDSDGQISMEASFNSNAIEYSLDNENFSTSGTFSNLSSGDYTVFVRSGQETLEQSVSVGLISQKPAKPVIVFSNNQLRLLASVNTIEWYYNDELIDDTNTTAINSVGPGAYYVIVRNAIGCESTSDVFTILGANDDSDIRVFPNPVGQTVYLKDVGQSSIDEIILYDLQGNSHTVDYKQSSQSIELPELNDGIYILHINTDDGLITRKIIKMK